MKLYRLGSYLHSKNVHIFPEIIDGFIRIIHNFAIYSETNTGRETKFGYGGISVVLHKHAVIGGNCSVGTNVTVGGRSKSLGVSVIGNNVYIATGAKILGDITIGNNSVIGANAVVINDVPENSVVAGVPAKVIKSNINSKDFY